MSTFSDTQIRALMKSLARAQYVCALGDQAQAMNPLYIRDSFEKMWAENSIQSRMVRDTAKWMVEFMAADPAVASAFTAPIDEAEKN